jgi:hypothetical protein
MAKLTTSLDRIAALTEEIESLKQAAISELMEKRNSLTQQLAAVDAELAVITGKTSESKPRRRNSPSGRSIPLQELKDLLANAPEKTLNIRKAGLEARNIKVLASANPGLLRLAGKGAWPTLTLLR